MIILLLLIGSLSQLISEIRYILKIVLLDSTTRRRKVVSRTAMG